MSKLNIRRAVENIRANTTVYTPIVEAAINSIQAIESKGETAGKISIRVRRSSQLEIGGGLGEVCDFEIQDNGIGFNYDNREAFDTLYTDFKKNEGGKGFGRFICLKYFEDVHVDSIYNEGSVFKRRTFSMGKANDIIDKEKVTESSEQESRTIVKLAGLKDRSLIDKKLVTIARNLVERLLPCLLVKQPSCPEIILSEADGTGSIRLNNYVTDGVSPEIKQITAAQDSFTLKGKQADEEFRVQVFKLYFPRNQKSRISLVAHKREVSGSPIHDYVPEFVDDFYDKAATGEIDRTRNYIIKAYVFSPYLDRNVSLERGGFEFQMENDLLYGISQVDIERQAANIAKAAVGSDVKARQEKKKERVQSYVDNEAPWHKSLLPKMDLSAMPLNPSSEEIETTLQKEKFSQESEIKRDVAKLLAVRNLASLEANVREIVGKISDTSENDLVHYIALRRSILELFNRSLQVDETGAYSSEGLVHDIIFPRKGNTEITSFENHNLWMIDERLNFTSYVCSDSPLRGGTSKPDLVVYDKRILLRGDNEPSNPVTIFEFKKPMRDDFVNPSAPEDPVQQIVRYTNDIRAGKGRTPQGREVLIGQNTPFYGFVVCDLSAKVEKWLQDEKNFKPMPDRMGWFSWFENINLYIEVIHWDKVLKDARMRNKIFFEMLGII
jgi:hypothetical protein